MGLLKDALLIATRPVVTVKTYLNQQEVGLGLADAPSGTPIEVYAELPLPDAIRARQGNLIPSIEWSLADQQRMDRGELPQSPPLHHDQ